MQEEQPVPTSKQSEWYRTSEEARIGTEISHEITFADEN